MRVAFYVRVSTDRQTVANQLDVLHKVAELKDWNVVAVLQDVGISGAKGREERPGFEELHRMIASREIDLVAVWALDRLGRSLLHLAVFLELLKKKGVGLYLHQHAIDTTTPGGQMVFGMMSVVAEFERELTKQRIIAGIERCKKAGKTGPGKRWFGRPLTDPEVVGNIRILLAQGVGKRKIAKKLGVGVSVVQRIAKSSNIPLSILGESHDKT